MKKILTIGFLTAFFVFLSDMDATAQRRKSKDEPTEQKDDTPADTQKPDKKKKKTDDYFDEKGGFKHRLWYGGNFIYKKK